MTTQLIATKPHELTKLMNVRDKDKWMITQVKAGGEAIAAIPLDSDSVFIYFPEQEVTFSQWLAEAELFTTSDAFITDHSWMFNDDGIEQDPMIMDILLCGLVYPIKNGYVFAWTVNGETLVVFVGQYDKRLEQIQKMRFSDLCYYDAGFKSDPTTEELLDIGGFGLKLSTPL